MLSSNNPELYVEEDWATHNMTGLSLSTSMNHDARAHSSCYNSYLRRRCHGTTVDRVGLFLAMKRALRLALDQLLRIGQGWQSCGEPKREFHTPMMLPIDIPTPAVKFYDPLRPRHLASPYDRTIQVLRSQSENRRENGGSLKLAQPCLHLDLGSVRPKVRVPKVRYTHVNQSTMWDDTGSDTARVRLGHHQLPGRNIQAVM